MIISGALLDNSLAWDISDTFNGLMMIPNLIGVLSLTPLVYKITRNYVQRKIKKNEEGVMEITPMLSAIPEVQTEMAEAVARGEE